MTLRERIALAMYDEIRQNDHGLGKQTVTGVNFDRVADAILALPELRALAAGKPLWVECETCGGTCYAPNARDDCPACGGVGFVLVALDGVTPGGEGS